MNERKIKDLYSRKENVGWNNENRTNSSWFFSSFFQIIKMRGIAGDSPSFSLDLWKRGWGYEWEEEKSKKSIIKNTFFKKILSYYFQKVKSLRKLSEFSKTPHFSPKLSFIIKTNPETENLFRRHINYAKFNF